MGTDKNIKLHIVTDIKVTINSLSAFGFRYLGGGWVLYNKEICSMLRSGAAHPGSSFFVSVPPVD